LSLDKQTNELVAFRKEWLKVPDAYKGVQLNEEQKQKLENGEKIKVEGMTSAKGKKFDGEVQFNADKRYFELIFNNDKRQSQNQTDRQSEADGARIPKTLLGVALSEKQQTGLKAGESVYVSGMKDREGQDFNAYVKINAEKGKLDFFKWNPDKAKKQGAEVTPDNAHQTQVAKNSEGKTTEATKNLKEPLKSGQTQPSEKQAEKKAVKKSKGVRM
jgi:primosomal replication protein N